MTDRPNKWCDENTLHDWLMANHPIVFDEWLDHAEVIDLWEWLEQQRFMLMKAFVEWWRDDAPPYVREFPPKPINWHRKQRNEP